MLQAWPQKSGDYLLIDGNTYYLREKIKAAGGRWDATRKHWTVTREEAVSLGAEIIVHVMRGPVCCEVNMGIESVRSPATESEVERGETRVVFCQHCDSRLDRMARILALVDRS
jgi:hypothetical protein